MVFRGWCEGPQYVEDVLSCSEKHVQAYISKTIIGVDLGQKHSPSFSCVCGPKCCEEEQEGVKVGNWPFHFSDSLMWAFH